jgi:hypothetical protein
MKRNRSLSWILVLAAIFCLSGCSLVQVISPTEDPNTLVTELTTVVGGAEDLAAMDQYPNLTNLDLRGSDCYSDILDYAASHPQVQVLYDVALGGARWPQDTTALVLSDGSFTTDELLANAMYLPQLKSVTLPMTTLDTELIQAMKSDLGDVSLEYTVNLLGEELASDTQSLNLSALTPEDVNAVVPALMLLPELNALQLMPAEGPSMLNPADVRKLMNAAPGAAVEYSFELFGVTITTADERVEFLNVPIGNEGVQQVRDALDILPNCTYLLMDTCGVDNEIMAQMREDYAERTKVVWRVWLVEEDYNSRLFMRCGSYLTDTHRIRTTYVTDENSHVLNYCTETKYVDVGHVWQLSQCEFLSYMPDLEVCIIAITEITDITPLANHEKLEYLELFTTDISDISPLITCPNIEHLNLSNMRYLDDVTPVLALKKLKRIRIVDSPLVSDAEKKQLEEALPDCKHLNMGNWSTAWGWRYIGGGKDNPDPRYALLCEQMEYDIDAYEYGIP